MAGAVRAHMALVEVDETDERGARAPGRGDDAGWGAPGRDDARRAEGPPRRRLRWWWGVPVVVAAVLAASMADATSDRVAQERADRTPALVSPLDARPQERWRADGTAGWQGVVTADGALVLVSEDRDGWWLTAHEATTGAVRWTRSMGAAEASAFEGSSLRCPSDGRDVGALVVCVVTRPVPVYVDRGRLARRSTVVTLDARDGAERGRWEVEGTLLGAGRVGDDLVVGAVGDDGQVTVTRRSARTGEVVWTHEADGTLSDRGARRSWVRVSGALVLADAGESAVLRASDGSPVFSAPALRFTELAPYGDGFATFTLERRGALFDGDGGKVADLPGLPAPLVADDGSAGDVVVVDVGTSLLGVDASTGRTRWALDTWLDAALVVDGVLVVAGDTQVAGVDVRDGHELWHHDGIAVAAAPASDGSLVLVPALTGGGSRVVAFDLHDGGRYWAVDGPAGLQSITGAGGSLLLRTRGTVVVLR